MSRATVKTSTALKRLMNEYKQLLKDPPDGIAAGPIDEDDFFTWECLIEGPAETPYEGGLFAATLKFPHDYPLSPPIMKFTTPILHPNVYKDGTVCISILHAPGDDPNMYESASERWSPIQSVEKILLSVMSMLAEPNDESGADVDASVCIIKRAVIETRDYEQMTNIQKLWREDRETFNRLVRKQVRANLGL